MKRYIYLTLSITMFLIILVFPKTETQESYYGVENNITYLEITISGEVTFPGTYVFFDEVTYDTLIRQAGGLTENANDQEIIYQQMITTNTQIIIPSKDADETQVTILVNINQAGFQELLTIPYMTETKAANLIIYREEHGAFQSIDTLINVKYIGAATLEKIRPYITI
ncbi:MAG: helix-hairpin-helix domain-containing protein [Acholeplasmataceae bacterium]